MSTGGTCGCAATVNHSDLDAIVAELGTGAETAVPLLQRLQRQYSYIPQDALEHVAAMSGIPLSRLVGVSTFYSHFRLKPAGLHTVRVCVGTACHVKGAPLVIDAFNDYLKIPKGDDTDAAGEFTIQPVACLGCCTLAPVVVIGDVTYGHVSPDLVERTVKDYLANESARKTAAPTKARVIDGQEVAEVRIGLGSCCIAGGAGHVKDAVERALADFSANAKVKRVGCVGMCHRTPLVEVAEPGKEPKLYANVDAKDARRIVQQHFQPTSIFGKVKETARSLFDGLLDDESWEPVTRYTIDVRDAPIAAFIGPQKHVALEHCGHVDPTDLDEFIRRGGFDALRTCLAGRTPQEIVDTVIASGLRGRGGGGFPTGRKWKIVQETESDEKYVVMNGDEGDPGAFMDRMLLESFPFRILEGLAIAACAVGARQGVLYIREEYPLAVKRMREAIAVCEERGYLGKGIFGTDFDLQLRIMEGAGAFVCGEETALLQSIQGRRGMPTSRPPYPAQSGLHGKPTLVNNVETYANVPWIFRHGGEAFAGIGTSTSAGSKVFALAGKIRRGGLIEVPMGITIRQVVEEIGGGVAEGRSFKAVQIGGPSGGCIPASLADTPIDFEHLNELGAIMGSGGLVVLDDSDCMVDISRYFMSFTQSESCGKCTFCRVGTRRMLEILTRLCEGRAKKTDLDDLELLCDQVVDGSLCGLGRTAPNPVISTLRHFRDEYEAHVNGRCPAGKCRDLIRYTVTDACIGCTKCAQVCPADAIKATPYERHEVIQDACTKCDACRPVCPEDAIAVE